MGCPSVMDSLEFFRSRRCSSFACCSSSFVCFRKSIVELTLFSSLESTPASSVSLLFFCDDILCYSVYTTVPIWTCRVMPALSIAVLPGSRSLTHTISLITSYDKKTTMLLLCYCFFVVCVHHPIK